MQFETDQNSFPPARVRMLQIIVATLAFGVLIFLAIVLVIPIDIDRGADEEGKPPFITYIAMAYGGAALLAGPIIATIMTTAGRRKLAGGTHPPDSPASTTSPSPSTSRSCTDGLIVLYVSKTIVAAAVYEAAALFLCVAYMLEHHTLSAILAGILAAGLLVQIPTQDRAQRWLDEQTRQLEHDRQMC